jgi:hypothetical protein
MTGTTVEKTGFPHSHLHLRANNNGNLLTAIITLTACSTAVSSYKKTKSIIIQVDVNTLISIHRHSFASSTPNKHNTVFSLRNTVTYR